MREQIQALFPRLYLPDAGGAPIPPLTCRRDKPAPSHQSRRVSQTVVDEHLLEERQLW